MLSAAPSKTRRKPCQLARFVYGSAHYFVYARAPVLKREHRCRPLREAQRTTASTASAQHCLLQAPLAPQPKTGMDAAMRPRQPVRTNDGGLNQLPQRFT
ncbi:hypothetical protein Abr02nite_84530 [Paractinoplanes brasiliensis]|nr:hypothetical protein Abr02nite_84530 [Actinoplanes brasiliensis]